MKLLVVKSAAESKWGSCKVISPNLHQLYLGVGAQFVVDWFELAEDLMKEELKEYQSSLAKLLEHIQKTRPDRLVFVDHLPAPPLVLAFLSVLTKLKNLPPIIFHVYGDFTYFARQWSILNDLFLGHPVRFIVASDSQQRLLENFLREGKGENRGIDKLCFPVNPKEYYFDPEERFKGRADLGVGEEDLVILYSGRISLQKNVDLLVKEFLKLKNKNVHLWVAGAFDDIGAEFMGYESYQGYMFSKIQSILENVPAEARHRIKFLGHLNKSNLRKVKAASDLFASFSLYHDEDYGMSPAEALATGLPSVLTDWGGYSSFANSEDWDCRLVPVTLSDYGFEIGVQLFHDRINEFLEKKDDIKKRQKRADAFIRKFSIPDNVAVLADIVKAKPVAFTGFNWLLEQHASALNDNWSKSKFNKFLSPGSSGYYNTIYKNYISGLNTGKNNES